MRSLFYTWACFMVSQFMYRVLVTILTQQGPRYLFANEGRIVCSWRAISYVRHGFVSCALCDSHSNTVKRWAGAWLNDELRWMLINLWLWHRLRRSSNWSWELLSTVGWMTAADLSSICRMSACRFFAQTATFCVVSATCHDTSLVMLQTQEKSCRQGVQNNTTFDDMSGNSRHVGNFLIVVWAQTQKLYDS